jgi:hypothetical protein
VYDLQRKWPDTWARVKLALPVMKATSVNVRRQVTKAIFEGNVEPRDTFDEGIKYFKAVQLPSRLETEVRLRSKYPELRDLWYSNMPQRAVKRAVMESPTLRKLDLFEQEFTGESMKRAERLGKEGAPDANIEWMNHLRFIPGEILEERFPYNAVPVLDDLSRKALRVYGSTGAPNAFEISPGRLLRKLRFDRYGPKDISDDQLMRTLTEGNPDATTIMERLLVMGFGQDAAASTATIFHERATSSIIGKNVVSFSGNDGFMQMFDWSNEAVRHVVTVDYPFDRTIEHALLQVGFMWSFYNGWMNDGEFRKVHVELSKESHGRIKQLLSNNAPFTRSLHHNNVYPVRPWTEKGQQ